MFTQKSNVHEHDLRRAYRTVSVNNSLRYILMRICTAKGCDYSEAYDLVSDKPS